MIYSQGLVILLLYEVLLWASRNPRVVPYDGVDIWFKFFNSFFKYGTTTFSIIIGGYLLYWMGMDWFGLKTPKQIREEKQALKAFKGKMPKEFAKPPYRPNWYYLGFQYVEGFAYGTVIYLCHPVCPAGTPSQWVFHSGGHGLSPGSVALPYQSHTGSQSCFRSGIL